MTHRIRHQILELELPREAGAVALQRRASRVFQEQVLPRLDEVFSRIAPADRVLRIDNLELDLGDIGEANWERSFVEKCVDKITRQVAEIAFELEAPSGSKTLSAEENAQAIFLYFLENGVLPWHAKGLKIRELEEIMPQNSTKNQGFFASATRSLLQQNPEIIARLIWQFSPTFSGKVIESVLGLNPGWMQKAVDIRQSQTGNMMPAQERITLVKRLLKMGRGTWSSALPEPLWLEQQLFVEEMTASKKAKYIHPIEDEPSATKQAQLKDNEIAPVSKTSRSEPETPAIRSKKSSVQTNADQIPVADAGLILLGVYLPPFFKKLGLDLSEGPSREDNPFKAAHLLHYLVMGCEHAEEPALTLPKILCGLNLEAPVPLEINLNETDKHEANRLLEAVVRNWPVLKNTSPDGLRSTFLQRAGLLSYSASRESWVLQVERQGQDLLLEKIPWSYSVVKLPWMTQMLAVEW